MTKGGKRPIHSIDKGRTIDLNIPILGMVFKRNHIVKRREFQIQYLSYPNYFLQFFH